MYRILSAIPLPPSPACHADLHTFSSATSASTSPPSELDLSPVPSQTSAFHGKLLRLHKVVSWIPSYAHVHDAQQRLINSLFDPSELLAQSLILVPSALLHTCNEALRAGELAAIESIATEQYDGQLYPQQAFQRPVIRHGRYLAEDEPYGLLVTDMTADRHNSEIAVELKPKWLSQSPNAPVGSVRCRNCALWTSRRKGSAGLSESCYGKGGRRPPHTYVCPLFLVSNNRRQTRLAAAAIVRRREEALKAPAPVVDSEWLIQTLGDFFCNSRILHRLRTLQEEKDPYGVLELPDGPVPDDFLVATTLRDCTLFLKIRKSEGVPIIDARFGDLDTKAPHPEKVEYWRKTEEELIQGGWYTRSHEESSQATCFLERQAEG